MSTQSSQQFNVGKNSHSLADQRLAESANTAKNQLISEINQFNYITEQSGTNKAKSFEEEETNEHMFFVSNPIKMDDKSGMISMGSVIKYPVTGIDSEGKFEVQRCATGVRGRLLVHYTKGEVRQTKRNNVFLK